MQLDLLASYIQSKTAISSLQRETAALQMEVNQARQLLTQLILTCSATNPQQSVSAQTTSISSLIHDNIMKIRANVILVIVLHVHYNL